MLDTILDGSAPARLVLVHDSLAAPAGPLIGELVARAADRGQPTLTIALTTAPTTGRTLDLSAAVKGYADVNVEQAIRDICAYTVTQMGGWLPISGEGAVWELYETMPPTTQVYIEAVDLLAEDYGTAVAYRILRLVLSKVQAPGRLLLALPTSPLFTDLLSSTLSPSLALLTVHHPRAVESTSRALLMPATDDRFWHHLSPGMGDALALRGAADVDVNCSDAYVVQVLLRKATGGAKAMGRSVEGFGRIKAASGASSRQEPQRWEITPLEHVVQASPLADVKTTTHADLALPFNLSLTDRQRAERGAVPLPYAHEGEGADLGMGMDWSDDEEDDEI